MHEAITYSFTHPTETEWFTTLNGKVKPVALSMPMSEDRSVLRTSFIPSLLDVASYNRNRKIEDVSLFEVGSVYITEEETLSALPQEVPVLAVLMTGKHTASQWNVQARTVDFYDIKGALESLFAHLGLTDRIRYAADRPVGYHPGRSASIFLSTDEGEQLLGTLGQIHPDLQRTKDLGETYVAELLLQPVIDAADFHIEYNTLPRFPAVERDLALVMERGAEVGPLLDKVKETAGSLLEDVGVFDVYTGDRIASDMKSVAISLVYRHPERTFTDEEITELHGRVIAALESEGVQLRK